VPLKNIDEMQWVGWLVDDIANQCESVRELLAKNIDKRGIPKCTVRVGEVNMWWRKNSLYIDVESNLDSSTVSTIHIQEYGTGLWVGRAIEGNAWRWNYYKRMAASAFIETIDRCIQETLLSIVNANALHRVSDFTQPVAGK